MFTIREARREDFSAVIALSEQWAAEPSTTGHYAYNTVESLEKRLGPFFLVAESAGVVVGFILGSVNGSRADPMNYQVLEQGESHLDIEQLYVPPDFRHRGIGGQLVARFRAAGEAQGMTCVMLLSQNVDWERTLRFYIRQGFRPWYFKMFTGQSTEERRNTDH